MPAASTGERRPGQRQIWSRPKSASVPVIQPVELRLQELSFVHTVAIKTPPNRS